MIQAPTESHQLVDEIVATLISRFKPRRIYLFGSRARGDARKDSDYDFLIEIERTPQEIGVRGGVTLLHDFPGAEIQIHFRHPGALERRKDDPGTIDWDVLREGKLLYSLPDLPAIRPGPDRTTVRERRGGVPRSFTGWLAAADRDMRIARYLSSDLGEFKDGICFHAQQAAEKFMKALIISRHTRPARTHDLVNLLSALRDLGIDLSDLEEDARFLTPFAVDLRYPHEVEEERTSKSVGHRMARPYEATESEARRALATAERVEAAVRLHLARQRSFP